MIARNIHLKIPIERVGVLIGSDGSVKETIEKNLNLSIEVNSRTGDVSITSSGPDPSLLLRARDVILSIGRGFSPEKAFRLFDEDQNLCVINVLEIFGTPSAVQRIKSRIIGKRGRTRQLLEEETMTNISVYGNTISIIGDMEHLKVARDAIEMFIRGALHRTVYRYLNKKRSDLQKLEMEIWKSTPDLKKGREKHV